MLALTVKWDLIRRIHSLGSDALFILFLQVSFSGEIEHDFGGVRAEFFHCLFEEMTRPEYGMFMYPEESSYMWFPVRVSLSLFTVFPDRKGMLHTKED